MNRVPREELDRVITVLVNIVALHCGGDTIVTGGIHEHADAVRILVNYRRAFIEVENGDDISAGWIARPGPGQPRSWDE